MNKFLIQGKNWDCTIYLENEGSFMDITFKRIICAAALAAALLRVSGRHDPGRLFIVMCAAAVVTLCGLWKLRDNW